MVKSHGPTIKDDAQYQTLREKGMSKEKAARIANSDRQTTENAEVKQANTKTGRKEELYDKAKEVGIEGRSKMNKKELIHALRIH